MPNSRLQSLINNIINEAKNKNSKTKNISKSKTDEVKSQAKAVAKKTKSVSNSKVATKNVNSTSPSSTAKKANTTSKSKINAKKTRVASKAKTTTKKSGSTVSKVATKKASAVSRGATKKTSAVSKSKAPTKSNVDLKKPFVDIPEYYDLPYRYNQTVVKVLYQNPNTLFAYWDVSDEDIENFKKQFGENFLYITKPVLIVHNLTDNYSFEIEVNDFANNWYIHVDNAKCKYSVQLGRRPNQSNVIKNQKTNADTSFVNVSFSNTVEMPNDHILFYKDNQKIYFKNIKTNKVIEKVYKNDVYGSNVKSIYKNYDLSEEENRFDFNNPSSNVPTSNVM